MSSSIFKNLKWTAIERFSNQLIQFIVSIIIARLISPEEYGILGILLVFINISQVFIDSGFGSSLIYFNKLEGKYLNTTFLFNLSISILLFIILFFSAPFVEEFYHLSSLTEYLRISSLILIFNSLIVVPTAILKIKLDFKSLSISNLLSNLISACIGIIMAYRGFGVWALIAQLLSKSVILAILISFLSKWFPRFMADLKSFRELFKYGVNIMGTSVITKFTDEGISFVIAKFLTPFNLGLFTRSSQFATFPQASIGSIINTVLFPSLSSIKDNEERYSNLLKKSIELEAALTIPLFLALSVMAKPIILLLLTNKWEGAIPIFQILCIGRIFALIAISSEQSLIAKGYSNLFFKQQLYKLIVKIIFVGIAMFYSIKAVAIADSIQTFCAFFITNLIAQKVNNFSLKEQIRILLPYLLSSVIACIVVAFVNIDNLYLLLGADILLFTCVYLLALNYLFNIRLIRDIYQRIINNR